MTLDQHLLFSLIRRVKDMYIVSQLYSDDEAFPEIQDILWESARRIKDWEKGQQPKEEVDRG